jgi:hypothetical protein
MPTLLPASPPANPSSATRLSTFASALALATLLLLASPELQAQSADRIALIEQVTSASCGPCASQNPGFNALLDNNTEDLAIIKYQRGGGGYVDPMWDFNPTQVDSRIASYYGVFSFPQTWINGEYRGTPGSLNQSDIDAALAEPAWWDIQIEQVYNEATQELEIGTMFTALRDMQDGPDNHLKAFVVIIEEEVNYASPPGSNGETDFRWVMRSMVSGSSGVHLGQQLAGQLTPFSYTYPVNVDELDPARLKVVAFVQTLTTREVAQAAVYREAETTGIESPAVLSDFAVAPTVTDGMLTLSWSLLQNNDARIGVYNANGALVEQLVQENLPAGPQQRSFVLGNLSPGTYHAVLQSGNEQRIARFVVAR